MAKVKIHAGAEIDTITKAEMQDVMSQLMKSWVAEQSIGVRFSTFRYNAPVTNNAFTIGGSNTEGDLLGPDPGMIWDLRRLRVEGLNTADVVSLYLNDVSPSSKIADTTDITKRLFLFSEQVVLYPNDQLIITGSALNVATTNVSISGQVREAPMTLAWRFGG